MAMKDVALLSMAPVRYFSGLDMFTLMAMPFFILAGEIMNRTKITNKLVDFANTLVGHWRGGLAHANILTSVFFAGLTGAAVSDTAAVGHDVDSGHGERRILYRLYSRGNRIIFYHRADNTSIQYEGNLRVSYECIDCGTLRSRFCSSVRHGCLSNGPLLYYLIKKRLS